jgi:hypothetical protein
VEIDGVVAIGAVAIHNKERKKINRGGGEVASPHHENPTQNVARHYHTNRMAYAKILPLSGCTTGGF